MTFELSAAQQALRDRARAMARERLAEAAAAVDATGRIPQELLDAIRAAGVLSDRDALSNVIVVEELATASASIAAAAAIGGTGPPNARGAAGLRGAAMAAGDVLRNRLSLAAVALGIGRAAIDSAIATLHGDVARSSSETEKPHWVMADAATELEAARLLTMKAGEAVNTQINAASAVAIAKLSAAAAAQRAVDAALRIAGPTAYEAGALLERLARDARAVWLLGGTEEELRAAAASELLPG